MLKLQRVIDFLLPKLGKERKTYRFPGVVGLGAEALRFLDYLISVIDHPNSKDALLALRKSCSPTWADRQMIASIV